VLLDSFRKEPWLGFEVVGIYHDAKPGGVPPTGRATTNS
jgi:putative colanic acid biosynthesis UDP-glucose lipid carrier transferase